MHAQGLPCVLIRSQGGALPSKLGLGGLSSDTQKQACPPRSTPCANLGALPTWQRLEMDRALCAANMRSTDDLPCWGLLGRIRNTRATFHAADGAPAPTLCGRRRGSYPRVDAGATTTNPIRYQAGWACPEPTMR